MTIEKAIKIKVAWRKANYPPPLADEFNADAISIQALKIVKYDRCHYPEYHPGLLVGETEK